MKTSYPCSRRKSGMSFQSLNNRNKLDCPPINKIGYFVRRQFGLSTKLVYWTRSHFAFRNCKAMIPTMVLIAIMKEIIQSISEMSVHAKGGVVRILINGFGNHGVAGRNVSA